MSAQLDLALAARQVAGGTEQATVPVDAALDEERSEGDYRLGSVPLHIEMGKDDKRNEPGAGAVIAGEKGVRRRRRVAVHGVDHLQELVMGFRAGAVFGIALALTGQQVPERPRLRHRGHAGKGINTATGVVVAGLRRIGNTCTWEEILVDVTVSVGAAGFYLVEIFIVAAGGRSAAVEAPIVEQAQVARLAGRLLTGAEGQRALLAEQGVLHTVRGGAQVGPAVTGDARHLHAHG